jgi:hypothetical protein
MRLIIYMKPHCHRPSGVQELFFSGTINHDAAYIPENATEHSLFDRSGRSIVYQLHKDAPGFLLRNHLSPEDENIPLEQGATSSVFCYVPYGQAGGYGGRWASVHADFTRCTTVPNE